MILTLSFEAYIPDLKHATRLIYKYGFDLEG